MNDAYKERKRIKNMIRNRNRYRTKKGIPLDTPVWGTRDGRELPPRGSTIRAREEQKALNGPLREERKRLIGEGILRYESLLRTAKLRKIPVLITFDEYKTTVSSNACTYCGGTLPKVGCGVDRVNSDLGYALDNVVPCCGFCNRLKNSLLNHDETVALIALLKTMRKDPLKWPCS
jgi:hypothetical protein